MRQVTNESFKDALREMNENRARIGMNGLMNRPSGGAAKKRRSKIFARAKGRRMRGGR